jgi:serine phosphatase RsbU (regulator of sigma subunit)
MRTSFTLKLGILITLLTLVVTGGTLAYFYSHTKDLILEEVRGRLSDIAHTGTYLFRAQDRELISLFRAQLFEDFGELSTEKLAIPEDEARQFLPATVREEYHSSAPFQHFVQLLRQVQFGSGGKVRPPQLLPQVTSGDEGPDPAIQWVYLMAQNDQLRERDLVAFLADTYYQTLADGPVGNPIGNIYAGDPDLFVKPFRDGTIAVSDGWYSDQWGTFMTAVVPIKNSAGDVIATLGLDYSVGTRAEKLNTLMYFCLSLFGVAFGLAVFASFVLAGVVNVPISRLRRGAERFSQRDFSRPIKLRRRDEFGVLASTLNNMAFEIREYSAGLERLVDERTKELSSAGEEILKLNEKLQREKESLGAEVDLARELQQQVLPGPADFAEFGELSIDAWMMPADLVGGDYFDVIPEGRNRGWFAIGDVTGHGLESGVMMLMLRTAVRSVLQTCQGKSPESQYNLVNRVIHEDVERLQADKHMTLSVLHYEGAGAFTATGQHQDLLVIRDQDRVETLDTTGLGLPLGLLEDIDDLSARLTIRLRVGQALVLHTNGITEAENTAGQFYGLDRLVAQLGKQARSTPQQIREAVIADVESHLQGQRPQDDMTLLIIKRVK